jgi:hypothetical protein
MNNEAMIIEVGEGIGDFRFGMTQDALKKVVGNPDEIEVSDEGVEDEGKIEIWHYDEFELTVEFIEGNDWRLSTIAVNSDECRLGSVPVMGKKLNEVKSLIDALNLGEYESERLDLEDDHEIDLLSVFDVGLNFWFEDEELTEIQLSALEE